MLGKVKDYTQGRTAPGAEGVIVMATTLQREATTQPASGQDADGQTWLSVTAPTYCYEGKRETSSDGAMPVLRSAIDRPQGNGLALCARRPPPQKPCPQVQPRGPGQKGGRPGERGEERACRPPTKETGTPADGEKRPCYVGARVRRKDQRLQLNSQRLQLNSPPAVVMLLLRSHQQASRAFDPRSSTTNHTETREKLA